MDKLLRLKNRLEILKERPKDNGRIQAKLVRKIRNLENAGSR
jgi:hypothetical protein